MKLVATFHGPTSVSHSIKCSLSEDENSEYLVIAKTSVLEVFAILPDSLSLQCTLDLWSRISSLNALQSEGTSKQHILVTTDHPEPRLFTFKFIIENNSHSLVCVSNLPLHERFARPAEFCNECIVDKKNNVAVISAYVGKLKVVEFSDGKCVSDFDLSVRELNIFSMCFIRTNSTRTLGLAILHQDHTKQLILTSHELSVPDRDLSLNPSSMLAAVSIPESDSNILIPVPPHGRNSWNSSGGILVAGGSRLLYYTIDRKQKNVSSRALNTGATKSFVAELNWPYAEVTAWCEVEPEGTRYLLCDSFGRLSLLVFNRESPGLESIFLGIVSPPTTLTLLPSQYFFVGSHFGDSQLVRITQDRSSISGSFVDIADSFRNIAPILDAVTVDPEDSGENKIVTCSGGKSAGSIRIIQNGTLFDVSATLDGLLNTIDLFVLKANYEDLFHSHLLVTDNASSRLLGMSGNEENSFNVLFSSHIQLQYDMPTLACANVITRRRIDGRSTYENGPFVVQVTARGVFLINMQLGTNESQWSPGPESQIVLADISPSQICLALAGGEIVLLSILGDSLMEYSRKSFFGMDGETLEASALSFNPPNPGQYASESILVGFWSTREVKRLLLPSFDFDKEFSMMFPQLPRSIIMHDFGSDPSRPRLHLLVGLTDGTLRLFDVSEGKLSEEKVVSLGDIPVSLVRCRVKGRSAVLAVSSRASLFVWNNDSLSRSPILAKDVSTAVFLNTSKFCSSLVVASPNSLFIGSISEVDKLHMRTVPLGLDVPLKISYHTAAKAYGIGCVRTEISDPSQLGRISSSFKILDATTLSLSYEYPLQTNEEVTSVYTVELELKGVHNLYFSVGTMFYDEIEKEPSRGRVFLFGVGAPYSGEKGGHLSTITEIKGCAYALGSLDGKLVVAVNTGLVLMGLCDSYPGYSPTQLKELHTWNHNYLVTNLIIKDGHIIIGDAVNSIAVLRLTERGFELVARDYGPLWPLALEASDGTSVIGANSDNNLFTWKVRNQEGKLTLEREGNFYASETVNKFVTGSLGPSVNETLCPQHLYFTSTGRIGIVLDVDAALSLKLSGLQRNIANYVKGPGDMDRAQWRAPKTPRGRSDAQSTSFGFLDGDYLMRFLDYHPSSQVIERILAGGNDAEKLHMSYMEIRSILESIKSLY